ncbi:glycosyltransferase [Aestuariivivens sediminicola]|uniref:glycosyltransferase n=1 Tax=Aestuariivivens sediminicola TaxID=2913560 RepID=UPI001F5685B1|nr:glycosyltransferase [Aestuariivivens sediminicola]
MKRILVAPLNWGLGHATRSIPIIQALIEEGYEPVLASDGAALFLLQKEFPSLTSIELPSYNISYSKKGKNFRYKLLKVSPKLIKAIRSEKNATQRIVESMGIDGIISDNRLGICSKKCPTVFMTHQLNVLSGSTTWLTTRIHHYFIKKFDACWVPDLKEDHNLSGKLGHSDSLDCPITYIGPLSRFSKDSVEIKYDLMVLISGPEPQRTLLEDKLLSELKHYPGKIVFVRGVLEQEKTIQMKGHITIYNYMTSSLLEQTINESAVILSRSGYTTIMDLAKLNKKAYFIPTPGQYEQEYLAKRLTDLKLVPSCDQSEFSLDKLNEIPQYKGLSLTTSETDFKALFASFF